MTLTVGKGTASLPGVVRAHASAARAVEAQAKVTGGALNLSAQHAVQAERDAKTAKRQAALLKNPILVDTASALEPAHTATGEDARSPTDRNEAYYRRRQNHGQGGQRHGQHEGQQASAEDGQDPQQAHAEQGLGRQGSLPQAIRPHMPDGSRSQRPVPPPMFDADDTLLR